MRMWKRHEILTSTIMILFGFILAIKPGTTLFLLVMSLGIGLIIVGGANIFLWFLRRTRKSRVYRSTITGSVIMALVGLYMLVSPASVASILPVCAGVVIMINGILNLAQVWELKSVGLANYHAPVIMAVLTIILGAVILTNPFKTASLLCMVLGLVIIYNGLQGLLLASKF